MAVSVTKTKKVTEKRGKVNTIKVTIKTLSFFHALLLSIIHVGVV